MAQRSPSVLEIDRKLRDDFRRRVKDFGVTTEATDPLMAVLFRTVAQQIDQVYSDTAQLRQSLLHELMNGLEVQPYLARPAQAALRISNGAAEPRVLRAGTELNAATPSGERLVFSLDATTEVSEARIAVALAYQHQSLRILSGVELSETTQAMRPSLEAVPVSLGEQPALYLAVENLSPRLLSRHGLFFELGPDTYSIQHALMHEPWWIFGADGELAGAGLMRSVRRNGGVRELCFQLGADGSTGGDADALPEIADGFYAGRQYLFPRMDSGRELLCRAPRLLEPVLRTLFERDVDRWLDERRLWIKVPMPAGIPALHHGINNILLHAMTASNLFARNQTVVFARDGLSVPVTRTDGTPEFLVAPLSITSEGNDPYEFGTGVGARGGAGWFELHNQRLTLHPGVGADGVLHGAANVRLWLTNGALGNRVGPGDISGFANAASLQGVRVVPLTAASGGSDGEDLPGEERRFADALLTRGRIVTQADLETAALALDRRILRAHSRSVVERGDSGLLRVLRLELQLDAAGFSKPDIELPGLKTQVERCLRSRLVHGLQLEVEFLWQ